MNNLFSQIERYQQEENIFTAVFAYILEQDNSALLHKFFDKHIGKEFWSSENEVKLQKRHTERNDKKKKIDQPDITVETNKSIVFFEHKIKAKINKGQIEKYKDRLRRKYKIPNKCLVLITLKEAHCLEENNDVIFRHYYWSEIYDFLKTNIKKSNRNNSIASEFLSYMEGKEMNIDKITNTKGLSSLLHFHNQLEKVCNKDGFELLDKKRADKEYNIDYKWFGFGIRLKKNKVTSDIWCGFYFKDPNKLIFESKRKLTKKSAERLKLKPVGVNDPGPYGIEKDLIRSRFYTKNKKEQIIILSRWVNEMKSNIMSLK